MNISPEQSHPLDNSGEHGSPPSPNFLSKHDVSNSSSPKCDLDALLLLARYLTLSDILVAVIYTPFTRIHSTFSPCPFFQFKFKISAYDTSISNSHKTLHTTIKQSQHNANVANLRNTKKKTGTNTLYISKKCRVRTLFVI